MNIQNLIMDRIIEYVLSVTMLKVIKRMPTSEYDNVLIRDLAGNDYLISIRQIRSKTGIPNTADELLKKGGL